MISKIIWQTHEWDYKDLPDIYKKTSLTWQKLNPDWEYKYLNADQRREMIKEKKPEFLDLYDSYKISHKEGDSGMIQCDLWRVICLYEHGGVYADLDSICLGPLNQMLDLYSEKDIVISSNFLTTNSDIILKNSMSGIPYDFKVNSGAGFAARKNSVLLKLMIDIIERKKVIPKKYNNLWEIFSYVCINSDIDKISFDFRWSYHNGCFNHKNV